MIKTVKVTTDPRKDRIKGPTLRGFVLEVISLMKTILRIILLLFTQIRIMRNKIAYRAIVSRRLFLKSVHDQLNRSFATFQEETIAQE